MKTTWLLFRNYLFYLSESDSPKFLSNSRTFDCIKGLSPPLYVASLGKCDSFLPPFHIHIFFHQKSKTQFCPELSRGHNSHSTPPKLVILKPKLKFRTSSECELSWCFGIISIGVLYHKISMILNYCPNWNFSHSLVYVFNNFPSFLQGSRPKDPKSVLVQIRFTSFNPFNQIYLNLFNVSNVFHNFISW